MAEDIDVKLTVDHTHGKFETTPNSETPVSEGLGGKAVSAESEEPKTVVKNVE